LANRTKRSRSGREAVSYEDLSGLGRRHPAAALPFAFMMHWTLAFVLADGNVRVGNIQQLIVSGAFTVSLAAVFYVFHLGLTHVLVAWVACCVVAALYSARPLWRCTAGVAAPDWGPIREQAAFGAKVRGGSLVSYLNFRVDVFIVLFIL